MSEADGGQSSLKDRLLARPRRIWQATPSSLRPAVGVAYYSLVALVLRGLATLISTMFGESREFRISSTLLGVIVAAALISALAFGLVRSKLPTGYMTPWLLGQTVSWAFWVILFASSALGLTAPRKDTPLEIILPAVVLGLLLGFVFWSLRRKR